MNLTVQDVHDFVDAINVGRKATDLEPITQVRFDECKPNDNGYCLSATHLYRAADGDAAVYDAYVELPNTDVHQRLANAFPGMRKGFDSCLYIPEDISRVTDVFDRGHEDGALLADLRELFVEAGYVDAE